MPLSVGVRQDGETTSGAVGDYVPLQIDAVGRLKASVQPALYPLATGSITGNTQTVFCQVDRASNVMVFMEAASLVGHNVTFEGSLNSTNGIDGSWFSIQVVRSNANTIETTSGVLAATPIYAWEASVNGLAFMRVRATAHVSGTAAYQIQRGSYATEPIPAAQASATQAVSGSVTVSGTVTVASTALSPSASLGAATTFNVISAASTNATLVKATGGNLNDLTLSNDGATSVFVKLYNKATAPIVGTDVPVRTILVPTKATVQVGFGTYGYRFPLGLGVGVTTGAAHSNTGAVLLDQVCIAGSFT